MLATDSTSPKETSISILEILEKQENPGQLPTPQRQKYVQECRKEIDSQYRILLPEVHTTIQSDETIIRSIQRLAFLYEHFFRLENQEWSIPDIASIIYRDLQRRHFPKGKAKYVYDALYPFRHKYVRSIEHSTIHSSGSPTDYAEDFYRGYCHILESHLDWIEQHYDPKYLIRRDNQDLQAHSFDTSKQIVTLMSEVKIPSSELTTEDIFNLKKEATKEAAIRYPETLPAKSRLSQALAAVGKAFIDSSKVVEEEGIIDPITNKQLLTDEEMNMLVDDFTVLELIFKPVLDRKYKRDLFSRFRILKDAEELFKRSAAKKHGAYSSDGVFVPLTREIIGSWQTDRKIDFEAAGRSLARITDFFKIWYCKVRIPRGSAQSDQLSPKLSESAFGRDV